MDAKDRMQLFLVKEKENLLRILHYYVPQQARDRIKPEDLLAKTVQFMSETPAQWQSSSDGHLVKCMLWNAKRTLLMELRKGGHPIDPATAQLSFANSERDIPVLTGLIY